MLKEPIELTKEDWMDMSGMRNVDVPPRNQTLEKESLAARGATAGTAAVCCDVAVPSMGQSSRETVLKMWISLGDNFRLRPKRRMDGHVRHAEVDVPPRPFTS